MNPHYSFGTHFLIVKLQIVMLQAQESDHDSDSADSICLTDSEEEAEQFQGK